MLGKQHAQFGIASGALASCALLALGTVSAPVCLGITGLNLVGSLFPDIDHPDSAVSTRLFPLLSRGVTRVAKHRGLLHDPVFYLAIFAAGFALFSHFGLPLWILCGLLLGIAGHLFLDALTVNGTPFLYLFNKDRKVHLLPKKMRICTTKTSAAVVTGLLCALCYVGAGIIVGKSGVLDAPCNFIAEQTAEFVLMVKGVL